MFFLNTVLVIHCVCWCCQRDCIFYYVSVSLVIVLWSTITRCCERVINFYLVSDNKKNCILTQYNFTEDHIVNDIANCSWTLTGFNALYRKLYNNEVAIFRMLLTKHQTVLVVSMARWERNEWSPSCWWLVIFIAMVSSRCELDI